MNRARIVWFNAQKGFGYALDDDGNAIFVHYTSIESRDDFKTLDKDAPILLKAERAEDGTFRATKVRLVIPQGNA